MVVTVETGDNQDLFLDRVETLEQVVIQLQFQQVHLLDLLYQTLDKVEAVETHPLQMVKTGTGGAKYVQNTGA